MVHHRDGDAVAADTRADLDLGVRLGEDRRVLEDLREQVGRAEGVEPQHVRVDREIQLDAVVLLDLRGGGADHVGQRHRVAHPPTGVDTGEHEQGLGVPTHPGRQVVEPEEVRQGVGVFLRALQGVDEGQLPVEEDLVPTSDVDEHLGDRATQGGLLLRHLKRGRVDRVERVRQAAHLVAGLHGDLHELHARTLAGHGDLLDELGQLFADVRGSGGEAAQRVDDATGDEQRECQGEADREQPDAGRPDRLGAGGRRRLAGDARGVGEDLVAHRVHGRDLVRNPLVPRRLVERGDLRRVAVLQDQPHAGELGRREAERDEEAVLPEVGDDGPRARPVQLGRGHLRDEELHGPRRAAVQSHDRLTDRPLADEVLVAPFDRTEREEVSGEGSVRDDVRDDLGERDVRVDRRVERLLDVGRLTTGVDLGTQRREVGVLVVALLERREDALREEGERVGPGEPWDRTDRRVGLLPGVRKHRGVGQEELRLRHGGVPLGLESSDRGCVGTDRVRDGLCGACRLGALHRAIADVPDDSEQHDHRYRENSEHFGPDAQPAKHVDLSQLSCSAARVRACARRHDIGDAARPTSAEDPLRISARGDLVTRGGGAPSLWSVGSVPCAQSW
ncbi:hypothetical protein GALL_324720 [mine drainage metagenome]|uniref:Uncharacterized protein n=1 Tax=mine drainage metagenome TaxID=410659 RepID=A0A1J5R0U3_9ZZZZ